MANLAYYVSLEDDQGNTRTFGPDDDVPAWAAKKITNPSAWADGDVPSTSDDDEDPYKGLKKADLEAEVDRRNEGRDDDDKIVVDGNGTVADLKAALQADDARDSE